MRLREFAADEPAYYNPENDDYSRLRTDDTTRPRVTLKHLNRLKKMRAARKLENLVRRDVLSMMYGTPEPEAGAGGMPPL